jgi:hypothetical protein
MYSVKHVHGWFWSMAAFSFAQRPYIRSESLMAVLPILVFKRSFLLVLDNGFSEKKSIPEEGKKLTKRSDKK